uniref:Uncharacterized protein n=1 Tax=Vannella robusta TaxID=1487602 RepID=A0A7S4ICI1_9EUKA
MVSGFIYLTDFRGDPENTNSALIEQIAKFHCPVLVCVNQVSRRLDSLPDRSKSEYYKHAWSDYIRSYLKESDDCYQESFGIEVEPVSLSLELTEFRDFNNELESKGIRDIQVVYEWIEEQMKILGFESPLFPSKKLTATL